MLKLFLKNNKYFNHAKNLTYHKTLISIHFPILLITQKFLQVQPGAASADCKACYLLSLRFDLSPLLLCIINSLSMKTNLQPDAQGRDFPGNLFAFWPSAV